MSFENKHTPDKVFSLADLESWSFEGVSLAVIGCPIKHSISPQMHNAALKAMAAQNPEFSKWRYFKFEISPDQLGEALPLFHSKGFRGINLTIPHKVQAVSLVAAICPSAKMMGAVNTLARHAAGFKGYNTDGSGLEQALKEELQVALAEETVILLGAGGAGRAAAVQCLQKGCRKLWLGNRSRERLEHLLALLRSNPDWESRIEGFHLNDPPTNLPMEGVLINSTSLGLAAGDPPPCRLDRFSPGLKVFDMIYNPPSPPLIKEAESCGMRCANGLSMLVWQGARALEIWSKAKVPVNEMARAAREAPGFN